MLVPSRPGHSMKVRAGQFQTGTPKACCQGYVQRLVWMLLAATDPAARGGAYYGPYRLGVTRGYSTEEGHGRPPCRNRKSCLMHLYGRLLKAK